MCPGNNESAGKRKSGTTRKGNPNLRTALVEAAQAAARKRDSYLSAQYRRLAARRGKKKAIIALGHSLLIIAYHVLKRRIEFQDLGPTYFDERYRTNVSADSFDDWSVWGTKSHWSRLPPDYLTRVVFHGR
jgi:hypothetical protein